MCLPSVYQDNKCQGMPRPGPRRAEEPIHDCPMGLIILNRNLGTQSGSVSWGNEGGHSEHPVPGHCSMVASQPMQGLWVWEGLKRWKPGCFVSCFPTRDSQDDALPRITSWRDVLQKIRTKMFINVSDATVSLEKFLYFLERQTNTQTKKTQNKTQLLFLVQLGLEEV